jgi:hypothetical protein
MGWLIGELISRTGWSERTVRGLMTLGAFLLLCGILGGVVACVRKSGADAYVAKAETRARPATDAAANQRADDHIRQAANEQEKHDVIHAAPDAPPSAPSLALNCKRLRDLGRRPAACS